MKAHRTCPRPSRLIASLIAAAMLAGCSFWPFNDDEDDGNDPLPPAPTRPSAPDPMTDAHAAFTKQLGPSATILWLTYSPTRSTVIAADGQALDYQNGTLTKTSEAKRSATSGIPLDLSRPADLLGQLSAKGACTRATEVSTRMTSSGFQLTHGSCADERGPRVVQVNRSGVELAPVDPTTKEGFLAMWSDLLTYGPGQYPIYTYEYVMTPQDGRDPGIYITTATLAQVRLAQPKNTPTFVETTPTTKPSGPTITYATTNSEAFWKAAQAAKTKCGNVAKVAVTWQGQTPVLTASTPSCSVTTAINGTPL